MRKASVKRTCIGLVHKDAGSDYGVSFPDLPGCVTASATLEAAREMAAEALALHLDGLGEDGADVPSPRSANAVVACPEAADALAVVIVEAPPAPGAMSVA